MSLSAKQLKAINWYKEENAYHLKLSTPPTMYFSNKEGKEVSAHIDTIVSEFDTWNEEDKKARARARNVRRPY